MYVWIIQCCWHDVLHPLPSRVWVHISLGLTLCRRAFFSAWEWFLSTVFWWESLLWSFTAPSGRILLQPVFKRYYNNSGCADQFCCFNRHVMLALNLMFPKRNATLVLLESILWTAALVWTVHQGCTAWEELPCALIVLLGISKYGVAKKPNNVELIKYFMSPRNKCKCLSGYSNNDGSQTHFYVLSKKAYCKPHSYVTGASSYKDHVLLLMPPGALSLKIPAGCFSFSFFFLRQECAF